MGRELTILIYNNKIQMNPVGGLSSGPGFQTSFG